MLCLHKAVESTLAFRCSVVSSARVFLAAYGVARRTVWELSKSTRAAGAGESGEKIDGEKVDGKIE